MLSVHVTVAKFTIGEGLTPVEWVPLNEALFFDSESGLETRESLSTGIAERLIFSRNEGPDMSSAVPSEDFRKTNLRSPSGLLLMWDAVNSGADL